MFQLQVINCLFLVLTNFIVLKEVLLNILSPLQTDNPQLKTRNSSKTTR